MRSMNRRLAVLAALLAIVLLAAGCGGDTRASGDALVSIGAGLSGPKGLTATVYSQGPTKLSAFAVDSNGRLWLATADSTDSGQDGVYVVAESGAAAAEIVKGLHTALGLVWDNDVLYVASKERVDAYTGFDGTAFADHHRVLTLSAGVGESNGLVMSPDGHLLLGISAPCDHCMPTSTSSAAIVSFQPDGTDLTTYANGIRAPVGLTYYPGTSNLFVSMNQRDDLGQETPGDWLAQVTHGQNWGFPDCYGQGGTGCTDQPQPVAVLDQHAAVSGVAIITGQLGATVGTSALVAEWADGAVKRVALTTDGSTYTGIVHPFLTGFTNPVPVLTAPDGAVFVGDWATGTIYRMTAATTA
jgi:glucose/arabinose dehydrogenase